MACPLGMGPLVVGSGGGGEVGGVRDDEGVAGGGELGDRSRPGDGVVEGSVTGASPATSMAPRRAHAASTVPATAPVVTARNPRRLVDAPFATHKSMGDGFAEEGDPTRCHAGASRSRPGREGQGQGNTPPWSQG